MLHIRLYICWRDAFVSTIIKKSLALSKNTGNFDAQQANLDKFKDFSKFKCFVVVYIEVNVKSVT